MKRLSNLILVSNQPDHWANIHPNLIKYIDCDSYRVIVPKSMLSRFQEVTDPRIHVIDESTIISNEVRKELDSVISAKFPNRFNWYLQQFLKVEYVLQHEHDDNAVLMWESDTMPLTTLKFVNNDDTINYYIGTENNPHYFKTLNKVIGIDKQISGSFIGQCLPSRARWVRAFCKLVTERTGRYWLHAVADAISGDHPAEFSEYESIGSYIYQTHRDQIHLSPRRWWRFGGSLFGLDVPNIDPVALEKFSLDYDFVAFENWDTWPVGLHINCQNNPIAHGGPANARIINCSTQGGDLYHDYTQTPWYFASGKYEYIKINLPESQCPANVVSEAKRVLKTNGILEFQNP